MRTPSPSRKDARRARPLSLEGTVERPRDPGLVEAVRSFLEKQDTAGTRRVFGSAIADFLAALEISTLAELVAVRPRDVIRYRNGLQERKLAHSTINVRLVAVRCLYTRLLVEDKIAGNPADPKLVHGLSVSDTPRTEALSVDEVSAILATCDGTLQGLRDRALLLCLYYEGLRRSEASKLDYRDLTSRRGLLVVRDAKTSDYETVKLKPQVRQAIEDYLEVLRRELCRLESRPEDPVFSSLSIRSFGRRLSPTAINEIVKKRAAMAGIGKRRITAHSLRATCATRARDGGAALDEVQLHLRHKDIRTTMRYDRDRKVRNNPTLDALPDPV